jgi:murein DD-endopeptidase MepM/ murein hydrolase activator NlpD
MSKKKISVLARASAAFITLSSIAVTVLAVHPATANVGHSVPTPRASARTAAAPAPAHIPAEAPDAARPRKIAARHAKPARKAKHRTKHVPFGWPVVKNRITVPFGWRHKFILVDRVPVRVPGREFHHGIDIACFEGRPIHASRGGSVVLSGVNPDYGNTIVIASDHGWSNLYGHMELRFVHSGQRVHQGQVIGLCGMSGRATGPHLHFEVRRYGRFYDPLRFLP